VWLKQDVDTFFEQWDGIVKSATYDVHDWLESDADNKIAIHFTLTQTWQERLDLPPYTGTYAIYFYFNDEQTEFVKFVEFIDTSTTKKIIETVEKGREKLGKGPLKYPPGVQ
jgi:hypothetical protein